MVVVNLLPWRARKQIAEEKMLKKILALSALAAVFVATMMHYLFASHTEALRAEKEALDLHYKKLQQTKWLAQSGEIATMSETVLPKLLRELAESTADDVCFAEINMAKNKYTFTGRAVSIADFTEFIKNWRAASLFSDIHVLTLQDKQSYVQFRFQAQERSAV